jgi:hypothetical protein
MRARSYALMSAHTRIACIFASVLHITSALAAVDADTISGPDSGAVERIIGCASAGKEAVLLPEGIECKDYRTGYMFHRMQIPDMPLKIDADQICAASENKPKDWRQLSGNAIKRIVSLKSSADPRGIRIIGAVFCDQLELVGLDLPYSLIIDRSLFLRGFEARNFHIQGDLSFDGSVGLGGVMITRSRIDGSIFGSQAYLKEMRIMDSQAQGSLLFSESMISELAIFDTVAISSELSVRGTTLSYFLLQRSKVGGALDLTNSQARCVYLITKSEIGDLVAVNAGFGTSTSEQAAGQNNSLRTLFDWRLKPNSPDMMGNPRSTLAANDRECRYGNIAFPGTFLVSDIRLRSSLCFRSFHWLVPKNGRQLPSFVTFNDLQVDATTFIDLAPADAQPNAKIDEGRRKFEAIGIKTNSFVLNSYAACEHDPSYYQRPSGVAEVRSEKFGDMRWRYLDPERPRIIQSEVSPGAPSIAIDHLDFNEWPNDLATSKYLLDNNVTFSPLLFEKITNFYKKSGHYSASTAIQYLKRNADYTHSDAFVRAALFVSWATVGYGLYPATGFLWFGVLTVIGYYVFRTGEKAVIGSYRPRSWLVYSIDTIIPVINLDPKHEQIRFAGWRQYYLYVMKIMSAVLVFLVLKVLQDTIVVP